LIEGRFLRKCIVLGAGGFIGSHLVKRLKNEGFWVRGVDLKYPEYSSSLADDFIVGDLRDLGIVEKAMDLGLGFDSGFDEVYQLAADMGGAGYIFTGDNDANVMHNSAVINLNVASNAVRFKKMPKIFYSSSACMYPAYNQEDPENPNCKESSAYPAAPDSEYGWEKLFSERLYLSHSRNYGLRVRIARYHNIFGPEGTWQGGKEKAPAAVCRKVIETPDGGSIEIWGDGQQTRSFLYIDECIEGTRRLMDSNFSGPVNIGSDRMIKIQDLAEMIIGMSGKNLTIKNIQGPTGVRGRNSDNGLIREMLGWSPTQSLESGIEKTYAWIERVRNES
jgi:nucleoside-diphosphate-sugar epimerase